MTSKWDGDALQVDQDLLMAWYLCYRKERYTNAALAIESIDRIKLKEPDSRLGYFVCNLDSSHLHIGRSAVRRRSGSDARRVEKHAQIAWNHDNSRGVLTLFGQRWQIVQ